MKAEPSGVCRPPPHAVGEACNISRPCSAGEMSAQPTEGLAAGREPYFAVDFGCVSSTLTVNLFERMSASLALTLATMSAGTLAGEGAERREFRSLYFIIENLP